MPCNLLHLVEQQDPRPYDDPDVKDLVGTMPQFYCTRYQPIARLRPGEAIRCIGATGPCWGGPSGLPAPGTTPPAPDLWDPKRQL